ncbi:hypothetical protein [Lacipirellula sp.]|uniref:hypothetical protein n=1 Tax=Lacipirellula sp. TaxID=2691419 RepID=UPI003D1365E7
MKVDAAFRILTLVLLLPAAAQAAVGSQLAKLTPSDPKGSGYFGSSVDISGNTGIVGAYGAGSAYLFDASSGSQLFKLTANDAAAGDLFGSSVGISGNRAIVGAYQDDDKGADSGSAYLFNATSGSQLNKLVASDGAAGDHFGSSAAISGNVAIVGAALDDDKGASSGSAYLFNVTSGAQLAKLTANDGAASDFFGASVAISGNVAIVGAYGNDDNGSSSGSAYLFDVTTGTQLFKLTANDAAASDSFGWSVAISGNTAIVGAYYDEINGSRTGSAYLFDVASGTQLAKLTANDGAFNDSFGISVGISGNIAVVGATGDGDLGALSGSAYLFDITSGVQLAKLTASDGAANDRFGNAVGIGGGKAIVGAYSNSDGDGLSGTAYLFSAVPEPNSLLLGALSAGGLLATLGRRR